jgi:hypothetical protein
MMKRLLTVLTLATLSLIKLTAADQLQRGFSHPPDSARPWVYWFWLNGNITSNGITADLAAMKRVGIGGMLIMEVDQGTPKGNAAFGGPLWRGLFQHVCAEAHRLGLEVNMNNDAGWCGSGGPWITPDLAMQKLVSTETNVEGPLRFEGTLPQPRAVANYYRDITVLAFPKPAGDARIEALAGKAAFIPRHFAPQADWPTLPQEQTVARSQIVNLAAQMDSTGHLVWNVPAGPWTILRLGHTTTGTDNHPAPEGGRGLESDKLSREATDAMFAGLMGRLIADSKPLAGKTLVATHIDSWETGSQNWTPKFRQEFQRLRGYDPLPFLPVVTGRVVDSVEVTERFLSDLRQTVSDLLAANYAGRFRELAHQRELRLSIEAYDGVPCDEMTYAGQADEPMAEFWSWGNTTAYSCTEMASAAHVYGKRILGAEAFTANDGEKWQHHPASIKALGDWAFCEGINRFVFHRYALQPWRDYAPGMSMGPWGLHYERTQTWWEQSAAWHEYLARCQYLLRQGLFVADILYLEPEGSPRRFSPTLPGVAGNTPERPRYNYDGCTPEVLLTRVKVKAGKLVLPDGMSYRLLVLPQVETMTPALLKRIKELVQDGATVVGPPPVKSPSLTGYPNCDAEVRQLATELWEDGALERGSDGKRSEDTTPALQHSSTPFALHRVIWSEAFKSPPPELGRGSPFKHAKWIWHREGDPAVAAPVGYRYFRRLLDLEAAHDIASAQMAMTADNGFELWVNGQRAGGGHDANQAFRMDVAQRLKPGTNMLVVAGFNAHDEPNPAGLIGALRIQFGDGRSLEVVTDSQWESAVIAPAQWQTGVIGAGWGAAMELGPLGTDPFPVPDGSKPPAYVFPDYGAITNVLMRMGVPPDFEADASFRYIHRRAGDTDIYFVSNRSNAWCGATATFRVSGKTPELWNPLTGEVQRSVICKERDGRTIMPLWLEPSGSIFVVFRRPEGARAHASRVVAVTRDAQDLLPRLGRASHEPPPCELLGGRGDAVTLLASQPGRYAVERASGITHTTAVESLPPAVSVQGPWEVAFQPNRGAPDRIMFDHLLPWNEHSDPGVRYFSGVATYRKTFQWLPTPAPGADRKRRQFLDLGRVEVIAEARLNGKDLGVLWTPPFRVEVTGALKPGENALEVKVVNLWANRQIGDEQRPEDSDRKPDGTLKSWPQWVREGKPSPTGRYTFTSWRLWKKNDALLESGLLGPVTLSTSEAVSLK